VLEISAVKIPIPPRKILVAPLSRKPINSKNARQPVSPQSRSGSRYCLARLALAPKATISATSPIVNSKVGSRMGRSWK